MAFQRVKAFAFLTFFQLIATLAFAEEIQVPDIKDTSNDILNLELPKYIRSNYPYYLSGYDEEGVPIWVAELGKWDSRKAADGPPEALRDFKLNLIQMFKRCLDRSYSRKSKDDPHHEFIMLFDMDGFSFRQTSSPKALKANLWVARQAEQALTQNVKSVYMVNANYVFTTFFEILRPILGRAAYKIEMYGTNKKSWMPKLLKTLPKDQIPEQYGGSPDHKPVEVFG